MRLYISSRLAGSSSTQTLLVQLAEFRAVPALPIPDPNLLGDEPGRRPARIWLHGKPTDDQLNLFPAVACLLVAQRPERPRIVLLDLHRDADLGKLRLDGLRQIHPFGLVQHIDGQLKSLVLPGFLEERLCPLDVMAVERLLAMLQ